MSVWLKIFRVDFTGEMIVAEVHYTGADNTWFAVGFSNYGELKPADYCVLWVDWHRQVQLQVRGTFSASDISGTFGGSRIESGAFTVSSFEYFSLIPRSARSTSFDAPPVRFCYTFSNRRTRGRTKKES